PGRPAFWCTDCSGRAARRGPAQLGPVDPKIRERIRSDQLEDASNAWAGALEDQGAFVKAVRDADERTDPRAVDEDQLPEVEDEIPRSAGDELVQLANESVCRGQVQLADQANPARVVFV